MKKNHPEWGNLPAEILLNIFKLIFEEQPSANSYDFAFVCKSWLHSAQATMYSKVSIETLQQLKNFHNTVKQNTCLGSMVKIFDSRIAISNDQLSAKSELFDLLTALLCTYLPNLEEISEYSLNSYVPTLVALTDSRLKLLKRLNTPFLVKENTEVANYILCASLMKDRLENLSISSNFQFDMQQIISNRLYDELHRFDKLKTLYLDRSTSKDIKVLEYVVKSCQSLKEITFYFRLSNNIANTPSISISSISIDDISKFIPATNIKSLKTHVKLPNDDKLLLYIMHKFPQLDSLSLNMKNDVAPAHIMNPQMLSRLLNHLSSINSFSVFNIRVDQNTITESIKNNWKATSKPGNERVEFTSKEVNTGELQTFLDLSKPRRSSINSASFKYYIPQFSWTQINAFIKKNGRFIRELRIAFESDISKYALNENFIQRTFTYCPNLQSLHFNDMA